MSTWASLKPVVVVLAITGFVLLVIAGALSLGVAEWIVPPPEGAAEQLVGALSAHRYEGASNQLSQVLSDQVSTEDLHELVQAIDESSWKGITDAHGIGAQSQGDQAVATVLVKFGNGAERLVELPMVKENGLWKVASLDALRALPAGAP